MIDPEEEVQDALVIEEEKSETTSSNETTEQTTSNSDDDMKSFDFMKTNIKDFTEKFADNDSKQFFDDEVNPKIDESWLSEKNSEQKEPNNKSKQKSSNKTEDKEASEPLTFSDYKDMSELAVETVDLLFSNGFKLLAKADSAVEFELTTEKKDRLSGMLAQILFKRKFKMSIELMFIVALVMCYIPMIKKAWDIRTKKMKKDKEEASKKKEPVMNNTDNTYRPPVYENAAEIIKEQQERERAKANFNNTTVVTPINPLEEAITSNPEEHENENTEYKETKSGGTGKKKPGSGRISKEEKARRKAEIDRLVAAEQARLDAERQNKAA